MHSTNISYVACQSKKDDEFVLGREAAQVESSDDGKPIAFMDVVGSSIKMIGEIW